MWGKIIVWFAALCVMVMAYSAHQLDWFSFFMICLFAGCLNTMFDVFDARAEAKAFDTNKKSIDDELADTTEEILRTREESSEKLLRTTKKLREDMERLRAETLARQQREQMERQYKPPPAPSKVVRLTPESLKVVRNLLMKHHEMKRTDEEYQNSYMCKNTNEILAQLNNLISEHR